MSGLAKDAVCEAQKVLEDLAGYLRAVGYDLTDDSAVQLDVMADRLEQIARECEPVQTTARPKLYCVKG